MGDVICNAVLVYGILALTLYFFRRLVLGGVEVARNPVSRTDRSLKAFSGALTMFLLVSGWLALATFVYIMHGMRRWDRRRMCGASLRLRGGFTSRSAPGGVDSGAGRFAKLSALRAGNARRQERSIHRQAREVAWQ